MSLTTLRQKGLRGLLSVCLTLSLSGCVYLVVGSVGALGGYVVSPDTVEGVLTGSDYQEVWDAAVETVGVMGIIKERNDAAGMILANIQGTNVTVTVLRMSDAAVKLTVKSRKAFLPKIKVSQDVYMKIEKYIYG